MSATDCGKMPKKQEKESVDKNQLEKNLLIPVFAVISKNGVQALPSLTLSKEDSLNYAISELGNEWAEDGHGIVELAIALKPSVLKKIAKQQNIDL